MRSLDLPTLNALSFSTEQVASLTALGEARGKQELFTRQRPETLESMRQVAVIESSESSNRIEGITIPRERVEALVLRPTEPRDRSEQEVAGYRDALALIHESHAHMPLSINVLLQLHGMLYRYQPATGGRYKQADNSIVERNPDGSVARVRFETVSAVQTPSAMEQLTQRYADAVGPHAVDPLIVVPLTILDLLCIHPFADGNGRVARLVTLLLLYHHGFEVGRYISLERIIEESKATYYESLEASSHEWHDGKHDPHPWLNYFWGFLLRAHSEFEERVASLPTGRGSKTEQVKAAVNRRIGPFAISDIVRDCPGVSRDMIRLVLRELRDEGVIVLQGRGRGAKWLKNLE